MRDPRNALTLSSAPCSSCHPAVRLCTETATPCKALRVHSFLSPHLVAFSVPTSLDSCVTPSTDQVQELTVQLRGLTSAHAAAVLAAAKHHDGLVLQHSEAMAALRLQGALELQQATASLRECLAAAHEENLAEKMAELQSAHLEELRLKGVFLAGTFERLVGY